MNPWMMVSRKGKGRIQKENEIVQSSNRAPNSQIKEGCRFKALNNVEIMGEDIEFTKDSQDHPSENNQTAVAFTHRAKPTMTYQNSNTNFDHANKQRINKPHAKNTKHSNGDVSCPAEPSHSKAMQENTMTRKNYFPQNTLTKVLTNVPTSLNPDKHTTVTFTPATNQFISRKNAAFTSSFSDKILDDVMDNIDKPLTSPTIL